MDGCVGAGETVFLLCESGYQVISGSLLSMLEIACLRDGTLDIWKTELCVSVECELPADWLKFTGQYILL